MTGTRLPIGFMQGRLSPLIEGKIQAFPWPYWEQEFALAAGLDLACMEWTLDQERIFENPLMTPSGRARIAELMAQHDINIPSLTGDFCMQAPFWRASGAEQVRLAGIFEQVLLACAGLGMRFVVVPLVDNGALTNTTERRVLEQRLRGLKPLLREHRLAIAFESDFQPSELATFIDGFPADLFGVNYDMGNSASLGWDPDEEFRLFGQRIVNVHVKDRLRGGTTVPLGEGAADLARVFALLKAQNYAGNYILQTARAKDGAHGETLRRYRQFVAAQIGCGHGS